MIKHFLQRYAILAVVVLLLLSPVKAEAAARLQDTGDKLVIVIDPGHGGDNRGTIENNHEEKFMTMTTALAMYNELLKYDGVEVYLTRTEDVKMSLAERAEFAASVDADFMFSIHYNASANHELFGSEVWVS
ncbi:MAG: N-acetylmuramoyl-L-alanine amidase, partial [Acetatifactor sp.]|nr:N-acetylmuramoyl-L-alanine amidase [Acetatifactor sp.]